MPQVTQDNRPIAIVTPLGDDVLLLRAARVTEGLSRLFEIDCELLSDNTDLTPAELLGKNVTIRSDLSDDKTRYFNGYVAGFSRSLGQSQRATYRVRVVPWLWFLTRSSDCRMYQDQSVPDIVSDVFRERGFNDVRRKLSGTYPPRSFVVQYRETDFNFVSRLLEEEGIYYYFTHENGKHTLVLADSPAAHEPAAGYDTLRFHPTSAGETGGDAVHALMLSGQVQSGAFATTDFDFEQPGKDLVTRSAFDSKYANGDAELFDYPGGFTTVAAGITVAKRRAEEQAVDHETLGGSGDVRGVACGATFSIQDAPSASLDRRWLCTSATHDMENDSFGGDIGEGATYRSQFAAIDASRPFRPPRLTPKPVIQGPQTAIVCGKAGEEIDADEHGRVHVRFHWDRRSQSDQTSSCRIRVSQNLAGNKWGGLVLPRIGQEVIVEFLEGDPDCPLVTGCVFNGENPPPYALPANATRSVFKTNSSKGGNGFHEFRIEDKKGQEQLFVHAERDVDVRVKRDTKTFIGRDAHAVVKRNRHEQVDGDRHAIVKGDANEKVDGTISQTAGADLQQKVGAKHALDAGTEIHFKAGMNVVIEAGMSVTLKAGGGFITVGPAGVAISGTPILINSGGSPGTGSGASPDTPQAPQEADQAQAGKSGQVPPPGRPPKPTTFSPAAVALKQAAENGAAFAPGGGS